MDNNPGSESTSQSSSAVRRNNCISPVVAPNIGVWIVNLLLTIITLASNSAWPRCGGCQYFYRHTEWPVELDFHGSPTRILIDGDSARDVVCL